MSIGHSPQTGSRRLALLGAVFLGAALLCDAAWLTRSPGEQGGMAFGVRRLGLRVALTPAQFGAVAMGMAVLGLACVAVAFAAAARWAGTVSRRGAEGAEKSGSGAEIGNRQSAIRNPLVTARWLAVALVFLACAFPWHRVVGWACDGLRPEASLDAAWERRYLFRELALGAAPRLFWLAALLALGAWVLEKRGQATFSPRKSSLSPFRLCDAMAKAVERLRALPRGLLVVAAAVLLTALAAAFILGIHSGQPCFPDASVYYYQARTFAAGRLASPIVGERGFFGVPGGGSFAFVGGRWFSIGLPGAPLLFSLGLLMGIPWLIPPLLGGGLVVATYLLAKEVFGDDAALLSLPLAALSPALVFLSGEYLTHVPCALATTLFLAVALRCLKQPTWLAGAAAGLLLGVGLLIRPVTAVALALPVGVAWLVWLVRRPAAAWRPTLALALALSVPLAGLLLYNRATTGHPFTLGYQMAVRDAASLAPEGVSDAGWRWTPALGLSNLLETLYLASVASLQWPIPTLGVVLASLVLLGVSEGRRRPVLIVLLSALSLAAAHVRWANVAGWMGIPRYFSEAMPLTIAVAAGVLVALSRRLGALGVPAARSAGVLGLALVLLFAHAGFRVAAGPDWRVERAESQARRRTLAAIRAQVKPPAIVFLPLGSGHSDVADFYAALARNDPALDKGIIFARDLGERNQVLGAARPGRRLYRWNPESGKALPLSEPPEARPAPRPE